MRRPLHALLRSAWRGSAPLALRCTGLAARGSASASASTSAVAGPSGAAQCRALGVVLAGATWALHGLLRAPPVKSEEKPTPAVLANLTPGDRERVLKALLENRDDLIRWSEAEVSWWEEVKSVKVSGLGSVQMFTRRKDSPGGVYPLFLGVAIFEDVTMDEMRYLTAAHEGCAKLRFDPALKTFETRWTFQAPWNSTVRFLRTHTHPMLLGIIMGREVDSICSDWPLPDGRWVECGFGQSSPRMIQHAAGSPALEAMVKEPPSPGMVHALDYVSGYIHEPMDDAARGGGRGRVRTWYFLVSEAGGNVPQWAAERGCSGAITNWFGAAHKELQQIKRAGTVIRPVAAAA